MALGIFIGVASMSAAAPRAAEAGATTPKFDSALYGGMKWRLIGPYRGGRVIAVSGVPGQPEVFYFGAVSGGVWKTTNGGVTWTPLTDKEPFWSVGSIAVAPSDPNVIYVGTGEACIRGDISHGDGVYKSEDGGKTWRNVGLKDTQTISKVVVNPHDSNEVFVAALGHVFGPNPERGVFRSTDGGRTWEKVLYKDDKTGGIDIAFDPHNSHILFAALWEASRTPYGLTSGGAGSGLYRSGDDGKTWKKLEGDGLPKGTLGRIGVSVSGADGDRVYALIEAGDNQGGLYRSDDGGEKWTRANAEQRFTQRAWYYMHVVADPKSVDTVYILNTGMFRSTDGGKSFKVIRAPHGDHHALWIDPANPQRLINGNDGGATVSVDGGKTWTTLYNQPTAQFYHVIADHRFAYYVYGAQQDNTSIAIASRTDHGSIDREDWYSVGGGESGYIAPDPKDPNIVYAGDYEGGLTRLDKRTGVTEQVSPWHELTDGLGAAGLKYRFQWTAPMVISPHDPQVIYFGAQVLFKSTDGGTSWTAISPDLTRNDKSKQVVSGGPITKDDTGTEYYDTIFSIAESPVEKDLIWVGSDDGLVHLTRDGGKTWSDVTPKEMPKWSLVSLIEASPRSAGTAYLAIDRHRLDDLHPYIYKTSDYGKSWMSITSGIPANDTVHAVREDPVKPDLLYAGTESGVYVSFDAGGHWQSLQLNLPTAPVHDLIVKNDDLVAATHGRAFWILDDITPLRQLDARIAGESAHLYDPRLTYRTEAAGGPPPHGPVGENAPGGAVIDYYLKAAPSPKEAVTLEILDSRDKLVREYSSRKPPEQPPESDVPDEAPRRERPLPVKAGMNRFVWDLRYQGASKIHKYSLWEYQSGLKGPLVVPGEYQVRLTAAGKTLTAPLEVKLDPRLSASPADLAKQLALGLEIRDELSRLNGAVNEMEDVRAQLKQLRMELGRTSANKPLISAGDDLAKKLSPIEEKLYDAKIAASEESLNYPIALDGQLAVLAGDVQDGDRAPSEQDNALFKDLHAQLGPQLAAWSAIEKHEVAAFNEIARKENVQAIVVPSGGGSEAKSGMSD